MSLHWFKIWTFSHRLLPWKPFLIHLAGNRFFTKLSALIAFHHIIFGNKIVHQVIGHHFLLPPTYKRHRGTDLLLLVTQRFLVVFLLQQIPFINIKIKAKFFLFSCATGILDD